VVHKIVPIVSVNTGQVALLGERRGRQVYSGIRKVPVSHAKPSMWLDVDGLTGDEQADRKVHGVTRNRTVYAYPSTHYAFWNREMGQTWGPGDFGENLTVNDILEDEVIIGEVWKWGEALLEVTGHRRPCYKLDMLRGNGTAKAMMHNDRCGWYFRVFRPGLVTIAGSLQVVERPNAGRTVLGSFRAAVHREPTVPDMPTR
jgi:MOSC domain-containing protein YiiM